LNGGEKGRGRGGPKLGGEREEGKDMRMTLVGWKLSLEKMEKNSSQGGGETKKKGSANSRTRQCPSNPTLLHGTREKEEGEKGNAGGGKN